MQSLRAEFPFFAANPGITYLDSAATALKPHSVVDALVRYNTSESVNIHRGVYKLSQRATDSVEAVRERVTAFTLSRAGTTSVFVRGTTEGINLLAHALSSPASKLSPFFSSYTSPKKPAILISESEHHANIVPWQIAAAKQGYALLYVPVDGEGRYKYEGEFLRSLTDTYALRAISLSLQSNVTGIVHDLTPFRELARRAGSAFVIDAAQAIVHVPQLIHTLAPDFAVFSGHKLFSSTGIGAVVGDKAVLDACDVYQGGGAMISLVEKERSTYLDAPSRFEAGTLPIGEIYALGAAIEFVEQHKDQLHTADRELTQYADEKFRTAGIRVFGLEAPQRSAIYSFQIDGVHAHDTGTLLDEQDICIRAGHHCCQVLMRALGVPATARASFAAYNNRDDVDRLIDGIGYVRKIFRK
jgi:cysteine desulfurase/selenocysteine lyase